LVTIEGIKKTINFEELEALSLSAGANVVFEIKIRSEKINSGFFVGSGKLDEIKKNCSVHDTSLVIFFPFTVTVTVAIIIPLKIIPSNLFIKTQ